MRASLRSVRQPVRLRCFGPQRRCSAKTDGLRYHRACPGGAMTAGDYPVKSNRCLAQAQGSDRPDRSEASNQTTRLPEKRFLHPACRIPPPAGLSRWANVRWLAAPRADGCRGWRPVPVATMMKECCTVDVRANTGPRGWAERCVAQRGSRCSAR